MKSILTYWLVAIIMLSTTSVQGRNKPNSDSLRRVFSTARPEIKNKAALQLARALMPDSLAPALNLIKMMRSASKDLKPEELAELNNITGLIFWYNRKYDSALIYIKKTAQMDTIGISASILAEAYNNSGTLYKILGNTDSATHYLLTSLKIDERLGNKAGIAKSSYDLASLYRQKNQYELAMQHAIESVRLNEELGNELRLFHSLNSLANIFLDVKDTVGANKTYKQAISLAIKGGDSSNIALAYSNYSAAMLKYGKPRDAFVYAKKALELLGNNNQDKFISYAVLNAATASAVLGFKSEAENHLRNIEKRIYLFNPTDLAEVFLVKSNIYYRLGKIDSANYYAIRSEELARANGLESILADALSSQVRIDSLRGNYFEALRKFQEHVVIKNEILSDKHRSRIEELRVIYELAKKESENKVLLLQNIKKSDEILNLRIVILIIILLLILSTILAWQLNLMRRKVEQQSQIISTTNTKLIELNKTKDKFLSIIAHDLKGPFNSLLGLLENLTVDFNKFTDTEKLELLKSLEKTSQNTYALLVNLLDWAKAQRQGFSNMPVDIEVKKLVEEVVLILDTRASQKQHQIIIAIPEEARCFIDRNILMSVLINLINNAIKFTPRGGTITLKWNTDPSGKGVICVEDNGIGIPEDKIDHIFELDNQLKRKGTEHETGTGLGLLMVKEFLEISGGNIVVQSVEGKGSTFCIVLP